MKLLAAALASLSLLAVPSAQAESSRAREDARMYLRMVTRALGGRPEDPAPPAVMM